MLRHYAWCRFITFWTTQLHSFGPFLVPLLAQRPRQPPSSPDGSPGPAWSKTYIKVNASFLEKVTNYLRNLCSLPVTLLTRLGLINHNSWTQGRIKWGETGAIAPGPPLQGGPPWWQIFVLNKIPLSKIVIHKRYKNTKIYPDVALSISVWSNYRPAGRMCPATAFSVARGSVQEKSSNLKFVEKRVRLHLSYWIACAE